MNRTNRIVLAVAVLALGGTSTFAQTVTPQPTAKTVPQSQASMAQAIQVAEKHTGALARKAEMERDRGVDAYEIKTVAKDKSTKVYVDVASGKVLRVDRPGMLDWIANLFDDDRREDQAALARLEASPMNLTAAISAAEREIGGRAVKASLRTQHGQPAFEVRMVKDLVKHKVLVDPASGKVVTIAQGKDDD